MSRPINYHMSCPGCKKDVMTGGAFFYLEYVELIGWCANCNDRRIELRKTYKKILDAVIDANIESGDISPNTSGGTN